MRLFSSPDSPVPRYRLVIFDFDGTLADSGGWFLSIADDLAERFGFRRVEQNEIETLRGMTSREVIKSLGIPRWKLPLIARHVHARLATETDRIALFEGVAALIGTLGEAGVRLAVVTSNAEVNARAILGPTLVAQIEWLECGASLFGKAPRFKRVLKRSGIAPGQVLAIGDETRDISAARKVGVDAAAVLWGYANREALSRVAPDLLFHEPGDVIAAVLGQ